MSKSVKRVARTAEELGLDIEIKRMGDSTRTAEDAAKACGCEVARIVKSLIFVGAETNDLHLLLVNGADRVDLAKASVAIGEELDRADANDVRTRTGFAIGGVSPIGHLTPPKIWIDQTLMGFETVWAAAGAPDAVFEVPPNALVESTGAEIVEIV